MVKMNNLPKVVLGEVTLPISLEKTLPSIDDSIGHSWLSHISASLSVGMKISFSASKFSSVYADIPTVFVMVYSSFGLNSVWDHSTDVLCDASKISSATCVKIKSPLLKWIYLSPRFGPCTGSIDWLERYPSPALYSICTAVLYRELPILSNELLSKTVILDKPRKFCLSS